jgi:hypothetical protein
VISRNNCWWNGGGEPVTFFGGAGRWLNGKNLVGRKGQLLPTLFSWMLPEVISVSSPIHLLLKIGFKPFDWTKAGVYNPAWIAKAKETTSPPNYLLTEPLPPKPMVGANLTFERETPATQRF